MPRNRPAARRACWRCCMKPAARRRRAALRRCRRACSGQAEMERRDRRAPTAAARDRLLSLFGFVAIWWIGSYLATSATLLPGPQRVALFAWHECLTGALPAAFGATLTRVMIAFVLAMLGGIAVGYISGRSARVNGWVDPWVVIGLNLPVLVVIVLAYIWVGLNDAAAILAVVLAKM